MKRSDPSGRCFHFCHRRLPLPHKLPSKPVAPAPGGCLGRRALNGAYRDRFAISEATHQYKQPGRRHKGRIVGSRQNWPGMPEFPASAAISAPSRSY
jgi:hypothetical protein